MVPEGPQIAPHEPGSCAAALLGACSECDQDDRPDIGICQTVTEIMVPCPVDDGTRDCCEVQSCLDPNASVMKCDNSGWHPPAYLEDLIAIENYFAG